MKINEQNIKELTSSKKLFLGWAKKIEDKFDGPSAYFYLKVISCIRNSKDYEELLNDNLYFEYVYSTLACWGMHRMDKNTRMANFDKFKSSILENQKDIIALSKENLVDADLEKLKPALNRIFSSLNVMSRDEAPKFVANTKVMHFLLPDLIPPMDKGHIFYFFYGGINDKGKKKLPQIKDEDLLFWDILLRFKEIAKDLNLNSKDRLNSWDTSIPKLIDNAIIGYNVSKEIIK